MKIKVLVHILGKRPGDIVLPGDNGGVWKHWLDNKCIFEKSMICEVYKEPKPKNSKKKPLKEKA